MDESQPVRPMCNFPPQGPGTSLALLAMLSHPALSQACISVYIAVLRMYLFLDKCVHLQPLPEDKL